MYHPESVSRAVVEFTASGKNEESNETSSQSQGLGHEDHPGGGKAGVYIRRGCFPTGLAVPALDTQRCIRNPGAVLSQGDNVPDAYRLTGAAQGA